MRIAWVVAVIAVAACTPPVSLGTTQSAIRGGSADGGDPAVVALSVLGVYAYCSATLIAPHTLLTAGHCNIDGAQAELGSDANSPTQSIDVADVAVHPMYTGEGKPYDFALMKLAKDPDGIAPVILSAIPLGSANLGEPIRHVGFGVTDDTSGDGGGTRRTVSYPLNTIDAVLIYSGAPNEQTCTGDSGGPGFMTLGGQTEVEVGVVSDGPNCDLSEDGWDDRVDVVAAWIATTTSAWDAPPTFESGTGSSMSAPPGDAGIGPDAAPGEAETGAHTGGCATTGGGAWLLALLISASTCLRADRRSRSASRRTGTRRRPRRPAPRAATRMPG
ncbi:MAG TPA: S1 family peptidase [Kofleriaceae bacterium]